jgi:hypothetical protein
MGTSPTGERFTEHQRFNCLAEADFVDGSTQKLDELAASFKSGIVPGLKEVQWEMHPTGFYKARLRELLLGMGLWRPEDDELGDPRLHTYLYGDSPVPENMQHSLGPQLGGVRNGHIHTHDWFIAGRPIETVWPEETFRDIIFDIEPESGTDIPDEVVAREGLLRAFSVDYRSRMLITDGSCVKASIRERRIIPQGQLHTVNPAVAHAVTIHDEMSPSPEDERFVSTLVISGHLVTGEGPYVYYDNSMPSVSAADERLPVSPSKIEEIQERFETFAI